jgi:ribosomal protein L24E
LTRKKTKSKSFALPNGRGRITVKADGKVFYHAPKKRTAKKNPKRKAPRRRTGARR